MRLFLLLTLFVFTACTSVEEKPVIKFIGISEGTLLTTGEEMEFKNTFELASRDFLGVVAFSSVLDGTTVQATWFSPDDRNMPMGRSTIQIASGATVAKFALSSQEQWKTSPYMLDIRAWYGEGESRMTASGSVQFFIGMNDEQIEAYYEEFRAWQEERERKKAEAEVED